jgi:hypothetical protein
VEPRGGKGLPEPRSPDPTPKKHHSVALWRMLWPRASPCRVVPSSDVDRSPGHRSPRFVQERQARQNRDNRAALDNGTTAADGASPMDSSHMHHRRVLSVLRLAVVAALLGAASTASADDDAGSCRAGGTQCNDGAECCSGICHISGSCDPVVDADASCIPSGAPCADVNAQCCNFMEVCFEHAPDYGQMTCGPRVLGYDDTDADSSGTSGGAATACVVAGGSCENATCCAGAECGSFGANGAKICGHAGCFASSVSCTSSAQCCSSVCSGGTCAAPVTASASSADSAAPTSSGCACDSAGAVASGAGPAFALLARGAVLTRRLSRRRCA